MTRPVHKELDGRLGHEEAPGRFRDRCRDNGTALLGRASLRYGWHGSVDDGCGVAAETLSLLHLHGYAGEGRPCAPGCTLPEVLQVLAVRRRTG